MQAVERVIADIAPTTIPVLLTGESGTGKEVVAMHIHRLSRRAHQPLAKLNCPTLTPEAINGNLRGHGSSAQAGVGTILLDEVGDLSAASQAKLLHSLPEDPELMPAPPRIISSTRRNLEEELRAGRFREELYYRLNGVCLRLPALRQRREDIPALADYFAHKYALQFGRQRPALEAQTLHTLQEHAWPGNVRELENVMRKMVALGDEGLALADLQQGSNEAAAPPSGNGVSLKDAAREAARQAERELILKVLGRTRWNRKRAAQELQISYKALLYKLKQIGLEDTGAYS
jgi:two-component system response regulator AtoC